MERWSAGAAKIQIHELAARKSVPAARALFGDWRCGQYWNIGLGVENHTTASRWTSLSWKLLILVPLAAALALGLISSRQTGPHAENAIRVVANIFLCVALVAQGVHWIVVKKWTGLGILVLIFASAVLGFGLHVLLRVH
jgi:hypothetical protein